MTNKVTLERDKIQNNKQIKIAVDVVIFDKQNRVLLGERLDIVGKHTWAFPGGHQKVGEKIQETARRELIEEIGSQAEVKILDEIVGVRENCIGPFFIPHITIMIKGIYNGGVIEVKEKNKCKEWKWFSLDNLPSKMFSGERELLLNYLEGLVEVVTDWKK